MEIVYRKLEEKDLEAFMELRIRQLREEGATEQIDLKDALRDYYHRFLAGRGRGEDRRNQRDVLCGKAAVFFLSHGQDRAAVQHVYGSGLPAERHREGTALQSGERGKGIRLRKRTDHCVGYGCSALQRLRLCEKREFYAV